VPVKVATALLAALQGGYLLAQTARDSAPLAFTQDMALDHVGDVTQDTEGGKQGRREARGRVPDRLPQVITSDGRIRDRDLASW
jgi:hypothetical protein